LGNLLTSALDKWHTEGLITRVGKLNMCRVLHMSDQHFYSYCRAQQLAQVQATFNTAKMHVMRVQVYVHLAWL
jgi:hypothetical protein